MPVRSDPATATDKWVTNLSNASAAITRGVNAVTVAPGQSAAKAGDKWLARVTSAKAKYVARVSSVSLQDWQAAMNNYGVQRVAQGAQAKKGKMQSFLTEYLPFLATGVAKVDAMPNNTLEDSINRMVTMVRYNATFKRTG
jgi:hypothetical protein